MNASLKTVAAGAAFAVVVATARGANGSRPRAPSRCPRRSRAPPHGASTANWITNGGNLFNQRYSPLTLLDRDNVKDLKALWRTSMGTGANPNNSGQAQILHHEGTLYVINGANDVFALDVDTGRHPLDLSWQPRSARGRADGPLEPRRHDGRGQDLRRLERRAARRARSAHRRGRLVGRRRALAGRLQHHQRAAVLRRHGHHGFLRRRDGEPRQGQGLQRQDGKPLWTFNTIPGPGEFGHDTWPKDSNAWQFGGAPVWQTPAVDPELGLVYFSTGNPGPELHGGVRPGDNLFSVSIVAVEARTGRYRWHFQQVHHDIWDYDSPNPVVLFDAPVNGVHAQGRSCRSRRRAGPTSSIARPASR